MWIDFSYFYSFRCDSHKIGGLNFASKPTQKLSIFVSKIIKFQNQSLSYSLPIKPKARCIKSCWPCIACSFARRRWIVLRSLCTRRFQANAKLFCKWMPHRTAFCNHRHRPKTLPCRVLCTNEKRINNKFIWR